MMNAKANTLHDYIVADMKLADWAAKKSKSLKPKCRA